MRLPWMRRLENAERRREPPTVAYVPEGICIGRRPTHLGPANKCRKRLAVRAEGRTKWLSSGIIKFGAALILFGGDIFRSREKVSNRPASRRSSTSSAANSSARQTVCQTGRPPPEPAKYDERRDDDSFGAAPRPLRANPTLGAALGAILATDATGGGRKRPLAGPFKQVATREA